MSIEKTINDIRGALGDPKAPWYGSDVVSWTGDLIEAYIELRDTVGDKMNKSIILLCKNHKCNNNNKGDCKLDQVSMGTVDKGAPVDKDDCKLDQVSQVPAGGLPAWLICEDYEEKPEEEKESK